MNAQRPSLLGSIGALAACAFILAGCARGGDGTATTTAADSTDPAPTTSTVRAAATTTSTTEARPAARLSVSPTSVGIGDTVTIELSCATGGAETSSAAFGHSGSGGEGLFPGAPIALTHQPADDGLPWKAEVVVPYWLEPGLRDVLGFCEKTAAVPRAIREPPPQQVEVLPPESGRWDAWRPVEEPWLDPGLEDDGPWLEIEPGEEIGVLALCGSDVEPGGASFVMWHRRQRRVDELRDDPFELAVYPVPSDGYTSTDEGLLIGAAITLDPVNFPEPGEGVQFLSVTALCAATPTPFEADAAPQPDADAAIQLWPTWW